MNNYSLSTNAPISEFIDMLREWLIAGNADPRAIIKVDEIHENLQDESELDALRAERDAIARQRDAIAGERDDIAEEFRALYDAVQEAGAVLPDGVLFAASACITRNKIT